VSADNVASARSSLTARLENLGTLLALRFPAVVALILRLLLLVPARWWPRRNRMLIRGFPSGPDFVRIPRDDVTWAAFCRGGAPFYAPEFTYEDNFLPDHAGETYCGLDGLRRAWTGFVEPFEEMAYELERIVGSGDRFVSIHRVRTKARHTGIVQDFRVAYVWTFRAGRLIHSRGFADPDQALKAVGLEE
jgi:ketosteroid isomerase-like protein